MTRRNAVGAMNGNWRAGYYLPQKFSESEMLENALIELGNSMETLKAIDPDGWEAWFDSDAVPNFSKYSLHGTEQTTRIVNARIQVLNANRPAGGLQGGDVLTRSGETNDIDSIARNNDGIAMIKTIISGGEMLEIDPTFRPSNNDEIPFFFGSEK